MPKPRRYLENVPGINVDTRSDTTRHGYHEGTIPYGAGSGLHVLGPIGLVTRGIDELDRQTNMTREDSPIYHPYLVTGEATTPTKATNVLEALRMVQAMKAAKAAKAVKAPKIARVMSDEHKAKLSAAGVAAAKAKRANMTTEELAIQNANRADKIKATWEAKRANSWQHTDNSGAFTRQELTETGLNNEDLSKHIITKRGGNRWVTKKEYGGSIHIKPSKRGTFTAAATKHGMGVQEFASKVLRNREDYSPSLVKKANFARNASKWNH